MKPTLYTEAMLQEYVSNGCWEAETLRYLCQRNTKERAGKEAVVDSKTRLSWDEVEEYSDDIALSFLELGLKKDDVILVQLYNRVELFLLIIACEKAGVIMAGCPPTFRHAEIKAIARHTGAAALVVDGQSHGFDYCKMAQDISGTIPGLKHIFVADRSVPEGMSSLWDMIRSARNHSPERLKDSGLSAFEVCRLGTTSGTTGFPKIIENAFCAYLNAGKTLARRIKFTRDDVVGAMYNITGGGVSLVAGIAVPLFGARLVLEQRLSAAETCELIEREGITVLAIVPALLVRLLEYPDLDQHDLSSLRLVISSTSSLPYPMASAIEDRLGCPVIQTYGAMDCGAIGCSSIDDTPEVRCGMVGRPYDCNQLKLVNEDCREVAQGEVGEVMVKGAALVGGYFRNPDLTSQTWQEGWVRVGDLGRLDQNGYLSLVGRKKDIIVRGGRNIVPKEIEELLMKHPDIVDVAVVKMPDPIMGEKACAYVVLKRGQQLTFDNMLGYLKAMRLAPFKLPERLDIVDTLPLVVAGQKVDRGKLEQDVANKLRHENA